MYEQLGAREAAGGRARFDVFLPDAAVDPTQYAGGGAPRIKALHVVGSFQDQVPGPGGGFGANWTISPACELTRGARPHAGRGWPWSFETPVALRDGFYEYKLHVEFGDGTTRLIGDPCTRYGGATHDNAGFTAGGREAAVKPLPGPRRRLRDLVIYELMIDDFTAGYRAGRAPLEAVRDRLDHLRELGVNAIEFMPWTGWPGAGFSWGYNPVHYFAVEHRYTLDPAHDADKLVHLKDLVNACHERGIQVILDLVFNHADVATYERGFPYYWLYQDPADCPYVGSFEGGGFFQDLDYANLCTHEFALDVCRYWIETFKIDGIRFDYTLGLYKPDDRGRGLARLMSDLRGYLAAAGEADFALILEHLSDNRYEAVGVTNQVGATGCWFDPLMFQAMGAVAAGDRVGSGVMRPLDAGRDFGRGRGPVTYIENHDHARLVNKGGGRGNWFRSQPWAIALFAAPGTPMVHNGQEFGEDHFVPESGPARVAPPGRCGGATRATRRAGRCCGCTGG
jgi:1,4-alpha-glucan branching enzyme